MDINFRELAQQIDVTDASVADLVAREDYRLGAYALLVDDANINLVDKGKMEGFLQVVMKVLPLADPDDVTSGVKPGMRDSFYIPLRPDGGEIPAWVFSICMRALHAIFPDDVPTYPRRDKESGNYIYNGEEIDKSQIDACRLDAGKRLMLKVQQILETEAQCLVNQGYFAKYQLDKNGEYRNLNAHSSEAYEDEDLVTEDMMEKQKPAAAGAEEPVQGGRAKKKKAGGRKRG
jgi:hypothetical protein